MKKLMTAAVAVALGASAFAGTYYVDANYGSDTNDGLGPGADHACKTLKYVMENLVDGKKGGDTVYAAPGQYKDGICTNGTTHYRALVPWKTKLIATGKREETFIIGARDPEVATGEGYGPNAVRGCFVSQAAIVKGFTICGGRTVATGSPLGAGVDGSSGSYIVDCIVSNNASSYRAGGISTVSAIGCYFVSNKADSGTGIGGQGVSLYNCLLGPGAAFNTSTLYNCTVMSGGIGNRNGNTYNSLFIGSDNGSEKLHRCVLRGGLATSSTMPENDCIVSAGAAATAVDADQMPQKGTLAVDYGRNDLYPTFPAAVSELAGLDGAGRQRVFNGTIDCGAVEYDWRDDFGAILSPTRVSVTAADPAVSTNALGGLSIPVGSTMKVLWVYPAGCSGDQNYHFMVALDAGVTLHVKREGEDADLLTITESGRHSFDSQTNENLVFSAEGESGAAAVSAFGDITRLEISDSSTGLTVTGASLGLREILSGESVDLSIARNFTTAKTCTGILVNGEFFAFEGETADNVWSRVINAGDDDVRIRAVYAEQNDWYVDPAGDNGNNGRAPYLPVKTLAAAAALAKTSGDVIHAAPGVYNEGAMAPVDTASHTSNRVVLAAGVGLVGAGASVTAIEGQRATHDADATGNGPDALRCVYCNSGAYVKGFTLRGGATNKKASGHDGSAGGGGLLYGTAIDCVITNNTCGYRGGGGNSVSFIRCKVSGNTSADGTGNDGNTCAYYGCVLTGGYYGSSDVYVNCTLLVEPGVNGGPLNAYNCVFESSVKQFNLFNCVCKTALGTGCTTNDFCKVNVGATGVGRDAVTYRPLPDAATIDAGDWTFYTNKFPKAFLRFADVDFAQGPRKIGAAIDAGAGEYDWRTDPPKGLALTVTDKGDGTTEVTVTRNFTSAKPAVGFTFGGETVMFDELPGKTWTKTIPTDALLENQLSAIYNENPTDWYVDAVNGDDANLGYLPDCPKHTLTGAVALAKSGHIVHAAPGVYREGAKKSADTWTRVIIPEGVGLVADGDGEHVIEGVISKELGHSGPDSVRCVACGTGAWVKGFVLRNGSTRVGTSNVYGDTGGGINGGTAIDCIITNCYAVRGGGSGSAALIRCVLKDCYTEDGATNVNGTVAQATAKGMNGGSAYDSYIGDDTLNLSVVRNCRCYQLWGNNSASKVRAYNSYVATENGNIAFTNCVVGVNPRSSCIVGEGTVTGRSITFDANSRPVAGQTLAIDRGKAEYYVYPDAFAHEQDVADIAGGQRVYNGAIDIGPGEYDWRGDFAKRLRRGVDVTAASANVTTNAVAGLNLANGDTLEFTCTAKTDGTVSFRVTGAGTVTVTYGGEPLEPVEGVYSVRMDAGTSELFAITYAGEGVATVSDVILPRFGSLLLIR